MKAVFDRPFGLRMTVRRFAVTGLLSVVAAMLLSASDVGSTSASASEAVLSLDASGKVTGYWSDGTANVELTATLRNEGDAGFEDAQPVAVTCLQGGSVIDGCGLETSISLTDGFGPTAKAIPLRVPMGEVIFKLSYGGNEPVTLGVDVPERILGVDRDVWECFRDTSAIGTVQSLDTGVGCAGWYSETMRKKRDPTQPVKIWASGRESYLDVFEAELNDLFRLLGLEFEWVSSDADADLVAYIGHSISEAEGLGIFCGNISPLGCASPSANEMGEIEGGLVRVHNVWDMGPEYSDLSQSAQQTVVYVMNHEVIHVYGGMFHRSEPDSIMSYSPLRRWELNPMDEALLRLLAHPLVKPGMDAQEIERMIVFSDELMDRPEDIDLTKWKLTTNAFKALRDSTSARFRVRTSLPDCNRNFGWADYGISNIGRDIRSSHTGWVTLNDGANHLLYTFDPVRGVTEYWRRSPEGWSQASSGQYAEATSGWRGDLTDPHSMIEDILDYANWKDASLVVDPNGVATLGFQLDIPERGHLHIGLSLDRETYVISRYGMVWESVDDACGEYRVQAENGQYDSGFELPDEVRQSSGAIGNCDASPLGTISGTVALLGMWSRQCRQEGPTEGYRQSYSFLVSDWSNVRIELSSDDLTSLHLSGEEASADLTVDQGVQTYYSTDYDFISAHWAQAVLPSGQYTVEVVTQDLELPGTFGLSISTSATRAPPYSFQSISSGFTHACALDSDGAVTCWGGNGELHAWPPQGEVSILGPSSERFTQVSSGAFFSCGLKPDGVPVCWGRHGDNQTSPPPGETFASISSGPTHVCALRHDGTPVCWGSDYYGKASPPPGETFVSISSGNLHTCALRGDGTPVCWGDSYVSPPAGETFVSISSGHQHACALRGDGTPVCWGNNTTGQASPPPGERFTSVNSGHWHTCALRSDGTPACWGAHRDGETSPPSGEKFSHISSGANYTCALRLDGSPVCWGRNYDGQASTSFLRGASIDGEPSAQATPEAGFVSITSGRFHTCALRSDATVACWGRNHDDGQALPPPNERFSSVSGGGFNTCGVLQDGSPLCWGSDDYNQTSWPRWKRVTGLESIDSGGFHSCALRTDRTVQCWSSRSFGQTSPPGGQFAAVSSGGFHTCALRPGGAAECWGHDGFGQSSAPSGERFTSISSGWRHTCALRNDGAAVCWGADEDAIDFGQASPPPDERFASVSSGVWHTCALRSDGTPVCWGWDNHGQASPPDQRFVAISCGMEHTCALTVEGVPVCWGGNRYGQISPPSA